MVDLSERENGLCGRKREIVQTQNIIQAYKAAICTTIIKLFQNEQLEDRIKCIYFCVSFMNIEDCKNFAFVNGVIGKYFCVFLKLYVNSHTYRICQSIWQFDQVRLVRKI